VLGWWMRFETRGALEVLVLIFGAIKQVNDLMGYVTDLNAELRDVKAANGETDLDKDARVVRVFVQKS
jgi:hypothetical protein